MWANLSYSTNEILKSIQFKIAKDHTKHKINMILGSTTLLKLSNIFIHFARHKNKFIICRTNFDFFHSLNWCEKVCFFFWRNKLWRNHCWQVFWFALVYQKQTTSLPIKILPANTHIYSHIYCHVTPKTLTLTFYTTMFNKATNHIVA